MESNKKFLQLYDNLATELWSATITENMLKILEAMAELIDKSDSEDIAASIKAAYCSVAVECTLKYIQLELEHSEYLNAVDRIWLVRIGALEPSSLLFSDELKRWKDDFTASVSDTQLKKTMAMGSLCSRFEAFVKLKEYLKQALQKFDTEVAWCKSDEAVENVGDEEAEPLVGLKNDADVSLHLPSYCGFYHNFSASTADGSLDAPKLHVSTKRKRKNTWTKIEEDSLRAGIARFGEGRWKEILKAYPVLMNRNGGNLKDKWRNMKPKEK